ncbi:hypothetical protein Bca101_056178 [Brassica carinata]
MRLQQLGPQKSLDATATRRAELRMKDVLLTRKEHIHHEGASEDPYLVASASSDEGSYVFGTCEWRQLKRMQNRLAETNTKPRLAGSALKFLLTRPWAYVARRDRKTEEVEDRELIGLDFILLVSPFSLILDGDFVSSGVLAKSTPISRLIHLSVRRIKSRPVEIGVGSHRLPILSHIESFSSESHRQLLLRITSKASPANTSKPGNLHVSASMALSSDLPKFGFLYRTPTSHMTDLDRYREKSKDVDSPANDVSDCRIQGHRHPREMLHSVGSTVHELRCQPRRPPEVT